MLKRLLAFVSALINPKTTFAPGTWFELGGKRYQLNQAGVYYDLLPKVNHLIRCGLFTKEIADSSSRFGFEVDKHYRTLTILRYQHSFVDEWVVLKGDAQGLLVIIKDSTDIAVFTKDLEQALDHLEQHLNPQGVCHAQ